jgi:hypothetical protein
MTANESIGPLIRPQFLKWSVVVFVVLLPLLAYAVWDYIETKRLQTRFEAIVRSGSPIAMPYRQPTGPAAEAERYYRAAASLFSDFGGDVPIETHNRIRTATRDGQWTPDLTDIVRARIEHSREALSFVDRAALLPFDGFLAGTSSSYQMGSLIGLARLCELRAIVLGLDGDGDAAMASFYSEARLMRALDRVPTFAGTTFVPEFSGLTLVLMRNRLSAAELERLARGLADIDQDDRLAQGFVRFRTTMLNDLRFRPLGGVLPRPFVTHLVVRSLDALSSLIRESNRPWTTRLQAVNAVGVWPVPNLFWRGNRGRTMLEGYTRSVAEGIQRIRCARLLVVGGRLNLADPFSGRRLEMVNCHL